MSFSDFLRRKGDDGEEEELQEEELDIDGYYVLSKEGAKRLLSWARFHAQLCEMMHEGNVDVCEDEEHKIAMLMVFAIHPWLLYYDMIDEVDLNDKDEEIE